MSATREVWGAEVSLLTLAAALQARGVDVAVVCPPGELAREAVLAGCEVIEAESALAVRGRVRQAGELWRTYADDVRAGDRLVLFSYILVAWAPLFRRRLAARGVRITLDLHDQLESRKAFWSVRASSEAVDTVIACSAFTAAQMGQREGVYALHRPVVLAPDMQTRADARIAAHAAIAGAAGLTAPEHPVLAPELVTHAQAGAAASADAGALRAAPLETGPVAAPVSPAGAGGAAPQETALPGVRAQRSGVIVPGSARRHGDHGREVRRGTRNLSARDARPATEPGRRSAGTPPLRVGIVGRISPEKRHEIVIEAVRLLDARAELIVRGSAFGDAVGYAARIDAEGAQALGAAYQNQGRVPAADALEGLDVVVVANPAEPMGRTVLEAQMQGVLAVVPDTGGSSELVEDGRTGLVYRSGDAADLARALRRVLDDPVLVSRIACDAAVTVPRPAEYAAAYLSRLG